MRYPIIKTVLCNECVKFRDFGDGEVMCSDPKRKASVDTGFDFSKPHICKHFEKDSKANQK